MAELRSLKGKEPAEALQALAFVTQSLLPNPGIEQVRGSPSELAQELLAELQEYYPTEDRAQSSKKEAKLFKVLSREMARASLAGANREEIENRLGDQGTLWSYRYKVQFSKSFYKTQEQFGVQENEIVNSIRRSDDVLHLFPQRYGANANALSLFTRSLPNSKVPHILLILADREGNTLNVWFALRVNPTVVSIHDTQNPLDLLRNFVEAHGSKVFVDDEEGKFFLYKHATSFGIVDEDEGQKNKDIIGCFIARIVTQGAAEIGLAFALDIMQYRKSLNLSGIANSK